MGFVSVAPDAVSGQGEKDEDAAAEGVDVWGGDATFLVTAEQLNDPQVLDPVATAVKAAGQRFSGVDWDTGRELSAEELGYPHAEYTPNFVSPPAISDLGVVVWADTKGELSEPMLETMLRILVEELTKLDVDTRVFCPPAEFEAAQWPEWIPSTQ